MAFSSLLFGGHSLWQAKSATSSLDAGSLPAIPPQSVWSQLSDLLQWAQFTAYHMALYIHSIDPRTYAWLISTLCLLILLAYSTNPGDSSFRSYLTELSLHQHLRQLHQDNAPGPAATTTEDELEGAARSEAEKSTTPHILTFANRISVSLRTPHYDRRDFMMFCTVDVQSSLSARQSSSSRQAGRSSHTRYIGAFGKWWTRGTVWIANGEKATAGKSASQQADSWGVYKMKTGESVEGDENAFASEKDAERQSAPAGGPSKIPPVTKVPESGQVKPSARRRKQAQKSRAALTSATADGLLVERKGSDDLSAAAGVLPTFPSDNLDRVQNLESPSPIANPSQANVAEASGSASALAEYQSQLDQIRQASEVSRNQLQTQLEELRTRKRDEDAARLDVKGKVKTLDESKRHAEGVKREAERRLKAAKNLKEAIENRIEGRAKEIEALQTREVAHRAKVADRSERKVTTIAELKEETRRKEEERVALDEEVDSLKEKLERLQARLLEEEANLEAAQELAAERDNAAAAAHAQREHLSPNSRFLNMYPLLSGPGDMPDTSANESFISDWSGHHGSAYGLHPAQGMQHSLSPIASDRLRGSEMDFDETFDPTRAASSSHSDHTHPTFAPFSFEQNTFQRQMAAQDSMHGSYTPPADALSMPPTPFTSDLLPSNLFQNADDDERHVGVLPGTRAEHVEEALNRFGLDSSDTSDLGDVEEGSVRELEEDVILPTMQAGESEEKEDESETQSTSEDRPRRLSRSWWGGRSRNSSKEQSGASISNNLAMTPSSSVDARLPMAVSSSDAILDSTQAEPTKRRSLSIFPKLSLNPGAKSFRGISKKGDADSRALQSALAMEDPMMQVVWNNSTGRLPAGQDFESMKRAFQTNNLQAEEEEDEQGRRSWSAFDTWQQQQQQQQRLMHSQVPLSSFDAQPASRQRGRFPSHLGWSGNYRSSSDSMTANNRAFLADQTGAAAAGLTPPSTASPSRAEWLDDAILPLHKSHSIEAPPSSVSSSSLPRSLKSGGKASRFAFWNSGSSSSVNNNGPIAEAPGASSSSPTAALEEGAIAIPSGSSNSKQSRNSSPAAPLLPSMMMSSTSSSSSSPSTSGTPQPSKRSSFRWSSRRQESSNDVPLPLSSVDKEKS